MSEIKLNIIDAQQVIHGTIHGSIGDRCVAALSAEPETIPELISALARYLKPTDEPGPFAMFHTSVNNSSNIPIDTRPWDAGIMAIDLPARIVACESTYSAPGPEGEVCYHDGTAATDVTLHYRLPDDWLFVNSIEAYQWSRERRQQLRSARPPVDFRQVLYGPSLLESIIEECEKIELCTIVQHTDREPDSTESPLANELSAIHARWLTTPRNDLQGQSPREVMLAKQELINYDLETRAMQWSLLDEGPPCLATDSFAFRFAGFGSHEWIIYYDLIRDLLWGAVNLRRDPSFTANSDSLTERLEQLKIKWLERPQPDYGGRIPAILIENERRRLPIAMRPCEMIIDEDCPVCQMFGDETSPLGMGVGFWHLDGCNMDDDFAFSSFQTRAEWEAEKKRFEEFNREFDLRMEERRRRIASGEPLEPDPYFDFESFQDLEFEEPTLDPDESITQDSDPSH